MQHRPTMVHGSHKGISITYDEQEVLVESQKPVEMQNWHAQVTLRNITFDVASPGNMPENFLTITTNFQKQSWEAVWAKTYKLCDGNLCIPSLEALNKPWNLKPGDEIIIKPGLAPQ